MPMSHTSQYSELTDEQAQLIGRFVTEWANVETLLGEVLARLLFIPTFLARVFTDEISASRLQGAISKAVLIQRERYGAGIVAEEVLSEIESINSAIDRLRGLRNRFAHFCWTRSHDEEIFGTGFSAFLPSDKRHLKDFSILSNEEVRKAHADTWKLVEDLEQLIKRLPAVSEQGMLDMLRSRSSSAGEDRDS